MNFNLPKIYRTKAVEGISIPGIINNSTYFFVDLEVYEDGRIDCWNFEDFEHFKDDVKRGWVSVNIPDGKEISIHGLGDWVITDGNWVHDQESFIEYAWSVVKHLNPNLTNIYKYSEKKVNGVTIGESGNGKIYKEEKRSPNDPFPKKVIGTGVNVFYKDDKNEFHLVRLDIYNKDSIIVNRFSEPFELNLMQLEQMISEEKIITEVPIGSKVQLLDLGRFTIKELVYCTDVSEKLLEIKDTISVVNGNPSSVDQCRDVYARYLIEPTESLRKELRHTYESIPEHERMFVGDMDVKDTAVRMIIYGEKEIENWSHYQIAKKMGEELPTINIPKPKSDT